MKRLFLAGFVVTAGLGDSVTAADLKPVPIYQPAVAAIAYFSWTGCYVGADVGALWAATDWIAEFTDFLLQRVQPFLQRKPPALLRDTYFITLKPQCWQRMCVMASYKDHARAGLLL